MSKHVPSCRFQTRYYWREMRVLAYGQFLESYRSVSLGGMAAAFGVSSDFLDQ